MRELYILCLLPFLGLINCQLQSPCPEVFSYEPRGVETDRWYGVISLTSRERLRSILLTIILDRPAELLGNWFGEVTSTDRKEYIIFNQTYTLEPNRPLSIRFFVKYNSAGQVPILQEIIFNGRTVCTALSEPDPLFVSNQQTGNQGNNQRPVGPSTRPTSSSSKRPTSSNNRPTSSTSNRPTNSRPTNTRPTNSNNFNENGNSRPINGNGDFDRPSTYRPTHTSRPITNNREPDNHSNGFNGFSNGGSQSNGLSTGDDDGFFPGDFALIVDRPAPTSVTTTTSDDYTCGKVANQPSPLISYGQGTKPGQWPWHAALYHSKGIQLVYTCGGTLVSDRHIITAAHCVTKPHSNRAIDPINILVYLGKYNLKKFGSEIQDKEVERIFVHPNYNYSVYFNDIAVLKLAEPARFTNYVRPCCLWEESNDLDSIVDRQGTVVGWGFDQNRELSIDLMQAQMPVVSTVTCIYSNREFFSQFTSEKTFCAGFRNGTTVCNGDSGGGMVFPIQNTGSSTPIWQLRGVVSVGVALQGQGICDPSQYIVFTDVAKHLDWIRRVMNS